MKHFTLIPSSSSHKARVLALGSFDGFHLGHRAVIDAAVSLAKELDAEPAVFCFDVPPACCILGSKVKILGDKHDRSELFTARGICSLFVAGFDELRGLDARDFITEILMKECGAIGVVCGFNFAFGKNRAGTPLLLRDYFKDRVITLDPIFHGELPVSSSRIRAAIADGNIQLAASMLGRNYTISCAISEGRKDGRKLGFPTINQHPAQERAIPSHGVYVTRTILDNGQVFASVTDVGLAPTLDHSGKVRLETHLLDTYIDYSPSSAKIEFIEKIRGEFTFNNIDELKTQIAQDVEYARNYFKKLSS
jgi:riboflavin kinase/FMN adenylyltransferase